MQAVFARKLRFLAAGAALLSCGCGSVARLGPHRPAGSAPMAGSGAVVATFVATVEPVSGRIVFRPGKPGVHALAAAYGAGDDVSLSGTAAYDRTTASLSGSITVGTTNVMDL